MIEHANVNRASAGILHSSDKTTSLDFCLAEVGPVKSALSLSLFGLAFSLLDLVIISLLEWLVHIGMWSNQYML